MSSFIWIATSEIVLLIKLQSKAGAWTVLLIISKQTGLIWFKYQFTFKKQPTEKVVTKLCSSKYKLQKAVDNLMKIVGAFNNSMKSVKQRVSELEEKDQESSKEKPAFKEQNAETNYVEINFLKETSNQNKQEIYTI